VKEFSANVGRQHLSGRRRRISFEIRRVCGFLFQMDSLFTQFLYLIIINCSAEENIKMNLRDISFGEMAVWTEFIWLRIEASSGPLCIG
jgi:hypothetical protein